MPAVAIRRESRRSVRFIPALLAALLILLQPFRAAAWVDDHDLWYVIEMAGKRAGWMHAAQKTSGDQVTNTSEMRLELSRGTEPLVITISTVFVETLAGKPVSMSCTQSLGSAPRTDDYQFKEDGIHLVSKAEGLDPVESMSPAPKGAWLTPAAAAEFVRKRLEAGATSIEYRTIDPMSGPKAISSDMKVLERTTTEALGRTVPAIKVETSTSAAPGVKSVDFIDEQGLPIRTNADLGAFKMTMVVADKDLALAKLEPAEMMARTLVKPDRNVPNARRLRHGAYTLTIADGKMPTLPDTGFQKVQVVDDRSVRVTVDREPADHAAPAPAADVDNPAFTTPSRGLDSADAQIKKLVDQATAEAGDDKLKRAEAMRRFVYKYINKKNLGVGFATASEVARSREGDCTEHGCLLAAMLRADGIPSRVASGLIYADEFVGSEGIFAYHMWTQGLFEEGGQKRWIDLDATLPASTPFDATHIAVTVTPLADDSETNPLVSIVPLLGQLSIKVERTDAKAE